MCLLSMNTQSEHSDPPWKRFSFGTVPLSVPVRAQSICTLLSEPSVPGDGESYHFEAAAMCYVPWRLHHCVGSFDTWTTLLEKCYYHSHLREKEFTQEQAKNLDASLQASFLYIGRPKLPSQNSPSPRLAGAQGLLHGHKAILWVCNASAFSFKHHVLSNWANNLWPESNCHHIRNPLWPMEPLKVA